ncbi:MAG: hypothetical protein IK093_07740, partial [Ruminiclostridium sp.]|nr:hypothetical protein [Ruminiclostridium sp.]
KYIGAASAAGSGTTVASELGKLYFGVPGASGTERLLTERVRNAAYMPTEMRYAVTAARDANDAHLRLPERAERYTDRRTNITVRNDIRSYHSGNVTNADVSRLTTGIAGGTVNIADTTYNEYMNSAAPANAVYRLSPGGTAAERTAIYERMFKTAAERIGAAPAGATRRSPATVPSVSAGSSVHGRPAYAGKTAPAGYSGIVGDSVSPTPGTVDHADYNYTYNTVISEYELPVTLVSGGAAAESVHLLPLRSLERMIIPGSAGASAAVSTDVIQRQASAAGRDMTVHRKPVTVARDLLVRGRQSAAANGYDTGAAVRTAGNENAENGSMTALMPESPALQYRSQAPARDAQPVQQAAPPQPDRNELIRQFGNLIEGADAGFMPSFEVGRHGIGEAMAAIEATAEKVAVNSKLIEEIRDKQREIERTTLRSSDMESISDEMIRRLRSRMRLDRSRFT